MNARKKLNNQRGESLTEVLVALLVGAMAIAMLAGAIVSSQQMILHSGEVMDKYYKQNSHLDTRTDGDGVEKKSGEDGIVLVMKNSDNIEVGTSVTVTGYVHHQGNDDIVAYAVG